MQAPFQTPTSPAVCSPFLELGSPCAASQAHSEQEMTYCSEIMWNIMFPSTLGRHSALTASSPWATGRRQVYEHLPNRNIRQWSSNGGLQQTKGGRNPPKGLWENEHLLYSVSLKTHLRPLSWSPAIFYWPWEKTPLSAFWANVKLSVKSDFDGVLHLSSPWNWDQTLNSSLISPITLKFIRSNQFIHPDKSTLDKPTRVTVSEHTPS